jgi:hypothetical protein
MLVKVKDNSNLVRDTNSGAILNTDVEAYNDFMKKKKQEKDQIEMSSKISKLENDILDIKNMIASLVGNK